ncbi:S1 RNA-binding domain-containing protein 1 [Ornithorhynchus anatinus]|nr:S1 RNA-binding domain-containing protein 1 [Ornithorhynchus anatinus]XP_028927677.1 S1 RNA-binding domain-containing protein 1 [Ornithorhynchus anatinus]XP_028927678.1 S1 RNA-binding domain-containing protein 1 [Ornithorhynchus anatinus]XP_028927679.1 S1 RNA-binding domain-containing protein 1 [Ornithorhynchus anatinus]XP_028927680.1 S1 RNA-binding domain-containing protein 1 [Ornithorhynchus anatinus]
MSTLPRRARLKAQAALPEDEMPSFLQTSSESDGDDVEDAAWVPPEKAAPGRKAPRPREPRPEKAPAARRGRPRKMAIKEEPLDPSWATAGQVSGENPGEPGAPPPRRAAAAARKRKTPGGKPPARRSKKPKPDEEAGGTGSRTPSAGCPGPEGTRAKKEEPEEDFTFDAPAPKKIKTAARPQGRPARPPGEAGRVAEEVEMNWDLVQVLSERTDVEPWVCANVVRLFDDDNTIPFIARYRKELINNLDADALREVQQALEELRTVGRKAQAVIRKIKKEGELSPRLLTALLDCRTLEELDHVSTPYKTGSKGTKAQRAKQLGLEGPAKTLLEAPDTLDLRSLVQPDVQGLGTLKEIEAGVQHILADMFAKDRDTLDFIRRLCLQRYICIQSALAKTSSKNVNENDINKFHLYQNFSCNIRNIQHHQILAINRGENLKILTVKVNIPDGVKNDFCRWCVSERWRPMGYTRPELLKILQDSVEDSYKRLIHPLLCREFRSKLTSEAEKESIMMFGRNLRQLLLTSPVPGRTLMGVDPGYKHGCKLAIISPTSQILHTDVAYLHSRQGNVARESEKIKRLLLNFSCSTVVIGNGTACRETEAYFADLIMRKYFAPLDVVYCIVSEAGASIYSVSPEAGKEMPDLDPNLRSAVSIARRVQDPLAELVKIEPKHIGVGMYQHDVSQTLLKATLDSVVEECVSFVGVDINICSETLLRHIAGLNTNRAKNIIEWREKNGPFVNREQLKSVKGLGPKSFQQCAGFIRLNQDYVRTFCSQPAETTATTGATDGKPGKKKSKAVGGGVLQPNPLDQTCIHPESYDVAMRFLAFIGRSLQDIGKPQLQETVKELLQKGALTGVAEQLGTTAQTLQIITDALGQPEGFDFRTDFDKPDFKRSIVCLEDLRVGAKLTGKVENATLFGIFVDIGVGKSGLIPIRHVTEAKLSKTKKRRSLSLGPGERVEVRVLNVDIPRSRITLDLIRVLEATR